MQRVAAIPKSTKINYHDHVSTGQRQTGYPLTLLRSHYLYKHGYSNP